MANLQNVVQRAVATGWQYVLGIGAGSTVPLVVPGLPEWAGLAIGGVLAIAASVAHNLGIDAQAKGSADAAVAVVAAADSALSDAQRAAATNQQ